MDHIRKDPLTISYSHYSAVPECCKEDPVILGVDEAGRGPVLGPMVYAVAYVPLSQKGQLEKDGYDDSKGLKEEERDDLFEKLVDSGWIGWAVHVGSPQDLSECMLRR